MKNNLKITKILAEGSYKSWMWFEYDNKTHCLIIPRELYYELKANGIPTSQSLRGKKNGTR